MKPDYKYKAIADTKCDLPNFNGFITKVSVLNERYKKRGKHKRYELKRCGFQYSEGIFVNLIKITHTYDVEL